MSGLEQAVTDVTQAKAMGFDAFALNILSTDSWSTSAIAFLFQAAMLIGFQLFFSFDMRSFSAPSQFLPLLEQYVSNPAYYKYNSLPFVSMYMIIAHSCILAHFFARILNATSKLCSTLADGFLHHKPNFYSSARVQ
jgi:hypothetical protein